MNAGKRASKLSWKYCWLKVICCICEHEHEREYKHKTGETNWWPVKNLEGHGPSSPSLRIATGNDAKLSKLQLKSCTVQGLVFFSKAVMFVCHLNFFLQTAQLLVSFQTVLSGLSWRDTSLSVTFVHDLSRLSQYDVFVVTSRFTVYSTSIGLKWKSKNRWKYFHGCYHLHFEVVSQEVVFLSMFCSKQWKACYLLPNSRWSNFT